MSAQDNKDIIQRGYEAFSAGDLETVMSLFDDDIEWVQPGESAVSGTFHGKTEVMEQFGRLAEKGLTVKLNRLDRRGRYGRRHHRGVGWWRVRRRRRRIHPP